MSHTNIEYFISYIDIQISIKEAKSNILPTLKILVWQSLIIIAQCITHVQGMKPHVLLNNFLQR